MFKPISFSTYNKQGNMKWKKQFIETDNKAFMLCSITLRRLTMNILIVHGPSHSRVGTLM